MQGGTPCGVDISKADPNMDEEDGRKRGWKYQGALMATSNRGTYVSSAIDVESASVPSSSVRSRQSRPFFPLLQDDRLSVAIQLQKEYNLGLVLRGAEPPVHVNTPLTMRLTIAGPQGQA